MGNLDNFLKSYPQAPVPDRLARRIWDRDARLWKSESGHIKEISSRLGWLDAPQEMKKEVPPLLSFSEAIRKEGIKTVILLGMGGSSLGPEVLQNIFGRRDGFPVLKVLDSTDPEQIQSLSQTLDLKATLFLFSSKSGTTVEPLSMFKYFFDLVARNKDTASDPGNHFVAITDPGTFLEGLAKEKGFRKTFINRDDIGGRFSVLSFFGLVPAALIGADIEKLLERTLRVVEETKKDDTKTNLSLLLGITMANLSKEGKDKLTLVMPQDWISLGDWIEQLVAESTGKENQGVVPIVGESLSSSSGYSSDRFFVGVLSDSEESKKLGAMLKKLSQAGHPVMILKVKTPTDLGGEFFRWEFATAVAGAVLKINPFDQPDVQSAKTSTEAVLNKIESGEKLELNLKKVGDSGLKGEAGSKSWNEIWKSIKSEDYISILAYLPDTKEIRSNLATLKESLRKNTGRAVTLGFGPRYLHSSGQLHKGGKNNGIFLIITAERNQDLSIPDAKYTFGQLQLGQALGDFDALKKNNRRVFHIRLPNPSEQSLRSLLREITLKGSGT